MSSPYSGSPTGPPRALGTALGRGGVADGPMPPRAPEVTALNSNYFKVHIHQPKTEKEVASFGEANIWVALQKTSTGHLISASRSWLSDYDTIPVHSLELKKQLDHLRTNFLHHTGKFFFPGQPNATTLYHTPLASGQHILFFGTVKKQHYPQKMRTNPMITTDQSSQIKSRNLTEEYRSCLTEAFRFDPKGGAAGASATARPNSNSYVLFKYGPEFIKGFGELIIPRRDWNRVNFNLINRLHKHVWHPYKLFSGDSNPKWRNSLFMRDSENIFEEQSKTRQYQPFQCREGIDVTVVNDTRTDSISVSKWQEELENEGISMLLIPRGKSLLVQNETRLVDLIRYPKGIFAIKGEEEMTGDQNDLVVRRLNDPRNKALLKSLLVTLDWSRFSELKQKEFITKQQYRVSDDREPRLNEVMKLSHIMNRESYDECKRGNARGRQKLNKTWLSRKWYRFGVKLEHPQFHLVKLERPFKPRKFRNTRRQTFNKREEITVYPIEMIMVCPQVISLPKHNKQLFKGPLSEIRSELTQVEMRERFMRFRVLMNRCLENFYEHKKKRNSLTIFPMSFPNINNIDKLLCHVICNDEQLREAEAQSVKLLQETLWDRSFGHQKELVLLDFKSTRCHTHTELCRIFKAEARNAGCTDPEKHFHAFNRENSSAVANLSSDFLEKIAQVTPNMRSDLLRSFEKGLVEMLLECLGGPTDDRSEDQIFTSIECVFVILPCSPFKNAFVYSLLKNTFTVKRGIQIRCSNMLEPDESRIRVLLTKAMRQFGNSHLTLCHPPSLRSYTDPTTIIVGYAVNKYEKMEANRVTERLLHYSLPKCELRALVVSWDRSLNQYIGQAQLGRNNVTKNQLKNLESEDIPDVKALATSVLRMRYDRQMKEHQRAYPVRRIFFYEFSKPRNGPNLRGKDPSALALAAVTNAASVLNKELTKMEMGDPKSVTIRVRRSADLKLFTTDLDPPAPPGAVILKGGLDASAVIRCSDEEDDPMGDESDPYEYSYSDYEAEADPVLEAGSSDGPSPTEQAGSSIHPLLRPGGSPGSPGNGKLLDIMSDEDLGEEDSDFNKDDGSDDDKDTDPTASGFWLHCGSRQTGMKIGFNNIQPKEEENTSMLLAVRIIRNLVPNLRALDIGAITLNNLWRPDRGVESEGKLACLVFAEDLLRIGASTVALETLTSDPVRSGLVGHINRQVGEATKKVSDNSNG